MGRRRQSGRSVTGILLLNKPIGITSNDALQKVKRLYRARKAGHTGSLDPLADGLLPICMGAATKVSAFLLDADKRYRVWIRLGVRTTTGDREGEVVETRPTAGITEAEVRRVLQGFVGDIEQIPPMYSALKHKGQRLYTLARQGVEVERDPRLITIYALSPLRIELPDVQMDVHCSKGTYVRTLAEDIGEVLNCGAHVIDLTRTAVGPFDAERLVEMADLEALFASRDSRALDELLLPVDSALQDWPAVYLSEDTAYYLRAGQPVLVPRAPTAGWVRLYTSDRRFMGAGEIQDDGRVAPRRLMESG